MRIDGGNLDRGLGCVRIFWQHNLVGPLAVTVLAIAARLALLPLLPVPQPAIHDEFSYLLAGDTFASGRLTNPTHPLWIHFETFHELSQPTYASKYPPGMGILLALGQAVFRQPWTTVLLGFGALCGTICWALRAWLSPAWAFLGGILTALRLIGTYWTESYWGGTLAAIGGALVVGALTRAVHRQTLADGIVFGAGLAILANSRPFEGAVFSGVMLIIGASYWFRRVRSDRPAKPRFPRRFAAGALVVLFPSALAMAYYNYRVTGSALLLPYQAYESRYAIASQFLFSNQLKPEPRYNHEVIRAFWAGWEVEQKQFQRDHFIAVHLVNAFELGKFFLGYPQAAVLALAGFFTVKGPRFWIPMAVLAAVALGLSVEARLLPHYLAPVTAFIALVSVWAIRALAWRFPEHRRWVAAALFLIIAGFEIPRIANPSSRFLYDRRMFLAQRAQALAQLANSAGRHLVLVRYGPHHNIHQEWVYNAADIDRSRVVWARDMPGRNEELLRYFAGRRTWLLYDDGDFSLVPYVHSSNREDTNTETERTKSGRWTAYGTPD